MALARWLSLSQLHVEQVDWMVTGRDSTGGRHFDLQKRPRTFQLCILMSTFHISLINERATYHTTFFIPSSAFDDDTADTLRMIQHIALTDANQKRTERKERAREGKACKKMNTCHFKFNHLTKD